MNVFNQVPGSKHSEIPGKLVGYMPQETALFNEFNINETLYYFGLIHNMKLAEIRRRRDFLIEFLDLPPKEKEVKNLRFYLRLFKIFKMKLIKNEKIFTVEDKKGV